MKLLLSVLVIFGLVAFIGAAPFEDEPEASEELKTEADLSDTEQGESPEIPQDEDEDIPENAKEEELNAQEDEEADEDSLTLEELDMQEDVQKDPSRIMTKTCRVFLTPQILSRKVYKCMYCCNTRCGRGYYGRLRSGQRVLFCRVSGGICTRTCKEMNSTTAIKRPTKGPSLRPPLATTRQPQPGSTQQPKPATTQQPEPETNPPPTQVNGTKFLKKENLFDGLFD